MRSLLIFFLLGVVPVGGFANANTLHSITVEKGLSNSTTFSVVKDERGLLWVSTKEGIDRYDGTNFKNYTLYEASEITNYGQRRNKFHIDAENTIWVCNFSDIFVYNRKADIFDKVFSIGSGNTIRDLYVCNKTNTAYLSTDKGLVMFLYKEGATRTLPEINFPVVSLAKYSDETLMLVSSGALNFLDMKSGSLDRQFIPGELRKKISMLYDISYACVDREKNIYLAAKGCVVAFKKHDHNLRTNPTLNRKFGATTITKMVVNGEGDVLIGTSDKGLFRIRHDLGLEMIYHQDGREIMDDVSDIFIDPDQRVWISGYCISCITNTKLNIQYYHDFSHGDKTLKYNRIRAIVEDKQDRLWVGTNYGISILSADRKEWSYVNPSDSRNRAYSNRVMSLAGVVNGDIIAGTAQYGIFRIDPRLAATNVDLDETSNYKTSINAMLVDGDVLWNGGAGSYLKRTNLKTRISEMLPITNVLSIIKSSQGSVIAGGHSGVHIITEEGWTREYEARAYNIGSIFCIAEDNDQCLWLASEGQGLIRFDPRQETFVKFTISDGLPSNLVYGIVPDSYGNLWLSTTKGISCFNIKDSLFKNYTLDEGLPIKEFVYGAYGKTRKGEIMFGGNNGFIIFNPRDLLDFDLKTNLIITDFKIFNKSVPIAGEGSPLRQSTDQTDLVKLKHNQNSITFEFASINLVNHANYYRRKLVGFEQEWSPVTRENYANYTNLKPGKYKLMIQWANTNSMSEIVKNTREVEIEIMPPLWRTTWAYLIYIVLAAGLLLGIAKFYLVKQSENRAKEKIRFFVNIMHDIRTPLSLIKSPLKLAIKKGDFSDDTLKVLKKAANNASRLTRLVDQLIDFEKDDMKKSNPRLSLINVSQTLDNMCKDLIPLMEQRGLLFSKNYNNVDTHLVIDTDKFDKIIFNLLSNAVKYSRKGGQISLSTQIVDNNLLISIADNGIGIPKEQQKYIFNRYFRASNVADSSEVGFGIGLMITKELVRQQGGEIWFESSINNGTTFFLNFPLNTLEQPDISMEQQVDESGTDVKRGAHEDGKHNRRSLKILIVEDNDELRELMIAHLKGRFKIIEATNGRQALEILSKTSVDTIISDVMMPVMDGTELCFEVKNNPKTNHIPFILLTALSSTEHKSEGYKVGADIYLEKPVDFDLLNACIHNLQENRNKIKDKIVVEEYGVPEGLSESDRKFVEKVLTIVEANFSNAEYSIDDMAGNLGMSHANLYRKFKELFQKTPLEYIQAFRLKKSIEFLQSGNYYINEVAYMVGFSDPKYFSNVFKKYYGKNASAFLKGKKR